MQLALAHFLLLDIAVLAFHTHYISHLHAIELPFSSVPLLLASSLSLSPSHISREDQPLLFYKARLVFVLFCLLLVSLSLSCFLDSLLLLFSTLYNELYALPSVPMLCNCLHGQTPNQILSRMLQKKETRKVERIYRPIPSGNRIIVKKKARQWKG